MKTQTSLIPHKHVRFAGSLIGMAGHVRQYINDTPISLDGLWARIQSDDNSIFDLDFTQLVYSLDILCCIQAITINESGLIHTILDVSDQDTEASDNEIN